MGWEQRKNGRFYYRSKRIGSRVVKQYIGGGASGFDAAAADAAAREERRKVVALNLETAELSAHIEEFAILVDQLVSCQLVCAGWRQHHRQWRPPKNARRNSTRP